MTRSQIRYALFRCKAGTADDDQIAILGSYEDQLTELGLGIEDFTKEWDISKTNFQEIVTGKIVKTYNKDIPLVIPSK